MLKCSFFGLKQLAFQLHKTYVKLSSIKGISLDKVAASLVKNEEDIVYYFRQLLDILQTLQRSGVTHRDIHSTNLLVSDEHKLFLIDFGWAVAKEFPYFTPQGLAEGPKLPDGTYSDVYSIGQVLKLIGSEKFPEVDALVELMVHPCVDLRIAELNTIKVMLQVINAIKPESHEALEDATKNLFSLLKRYHEAVRKFEIKDQENNAQRLDMASQLESLNRQVASLTNALDAYTYEYTQIVDSKAWRLVNRLRKTRHQLLPLGSKRDKLARFLWKSFQKIRRKLFGG